MKSIQAVLDVLYIFAVEAYAASWIEIKVSHELITQTLVEAYAASWIEIFGEGMAFKAEKRRSLCGFVD